MPSRPPSVCSAPGCPNLSDGGRCTDHRREAEAKRGNAATRGYDARWRKERTRYLRAHPICVDCGARSEVPDHHPRSRRELVEQGVSNPDAWQYLVAVCTSCHNRRTAQNQPGGFVVEK